MCYFLKKVFLYFNLKANLLNLTRRLSRYRCYLFAFFPSRPSPLTSKPPIRSSFEPHFLFNELKILKAWKGVASWSLLLALSQIDIQQKNCRNKISYRLQSRKLNF